MGRSGFSILVGSEDRGGDKQRPDMLMFVLRGIGCLIVAQQEAPRGGDGVSLQPL